MLIDIQTSLLGTAVLQLRRDLQFARRRLGGTDCYVVEDPTTGHFYRVSLAEYTFISLLDGRRTLFDAVAASAAVLGRDAFDEQASASLALWLIENQLATTTQSGSVNRTNDRHGRIIQAKAMQWLNPIMLRFGLGKPDGIASAMNRSVGWLFSWPIAILAIVLVGYAGHVFVNHWDRFYTGMRMVMSDGNWISLGIVTIALKLIHECGHMLMCKRYGGHVGGWGVMLLLLIPMPYVDVTSAWRFESKRARILVSAAGMMVEVVLAAIATLVWAATSTGEINQIAYNVMISASMVTLMFNINPLMRFDGYYMLSDALDLPNLANQGQQYLTDIG
ncbi:MAG: hypothetical protein AAFN70_20610, partial [Planctomycetota bacterium]